MTNSRYFRMEDECCLNHASSEEQIFDKLKRLDFDNVMMQAQARGESEESLNHIRRCWYPTEAERKEDEMNSKLAEIELRGVRYSAFDL